MYSDLGYHSKHLINGWYKLWRSSLQSPHKDLITPCVIEGSLNWIELSITDILVPFSLNANKLDELSKVDQKRERQIRKLLSNPNKLLATILIANNFINVSIIIVSYYITLELFDFSESDRLIQFFIQVVLITFILVLLGEITPKVYAKQNSVVFSKRMIPLINFMDLVFTPLSFILLVSTSFIDNRLKKKKKEVLKKVSQQIL